MKSLYSLQNHVYTLPHLFTCLSFWQETYINSQGYNYKHIHWRLLHNILIFCKYYGSILPLSMEKYLKNTCLSTKRYLISMIYEVDLTRSLMNVLTLSLNVVGFHVDHVPDDANRDLSSCQDGDFLLLFLSDYTGPGTWMEFQAKVETGCISRFIHIGSVDRGQRIHTFIMCLNIMCLCVNILMLIYMLQYCTIDGVHLFPYFHILNNFIR